MLALVVGISAPLLHAKEPKKVQINIQNFTFVPQSIEVQVGDVVEWRNGDFAPHSATADDGKWDTGPIKNGTSGRAVMAVPGSIAYYCVFHPQMKGVISVLKPSK